jgi:ligand-binding sensor domain-containing protein
MYCASSSIGPEVVMASFLLLTKLGLWTRKYVAIIARDLGISEPFGVRTFWSVV